MTGTPSPPAGYRPCVGILLLNNDGSIFVGERIDTPGAWQMPQGGIEKRESAKDAVFRELREETGIETAEFLSISDKWRPYTLPPALAAKFWGGRFQGQAQLWAALRFTGGEENINIRTEIPEFAHWKWTDPASLLAEIVDFKRDLYAEVLSEFWPFIRPMT